MSIQNLLRTSRSNYGLQFASLYRLTSIRRYSTKVNVIQANNIQMNASVKDKPITNTSDTKSYSFANRLFMIYNDYYKPTGSACVQFNHSINASLFAKYVNQKTFYGNKLNVELMKYIPKEIQMDPLNYRVGKCIILAGLPRDVTKSYLEEYLIQKSNKRFELADVTREAATISDTSKWLILSNSSEDIYFIFDRIHNNHVIHDIMHPFPFCYNKIVNELVYELWVLIFGIRCWNDVIRKWNPVKNPLPNILKLVLFLLVHFTEMQGICRYGFSEGSPSEKGFKIEAQTALDYIKGHEVFPHTKVIVYRAQYGMIIYNLLKVSGLIVDELAKTEGGKDIQSLFRRIMLTC
ncbi:alpha/beta hydrolase protein [Rhizophagus irregularis DAOM 181602=DAOM 197198]|nr:alpha/beta hydrolase protein [Rhizophagus irregularis DAOM 181602=DAOM 197198]